MNNNNTAPQLYHNLVLRDSHSLNNKIVLINNFIKILN